MAAYNDGDKKLNIFYTLSKMALVNPDSGSFMIFASQTFGPGTGFVASWVYCIGIVLSMSSKATFISFLLHNWFPNRLISISIIIISVTLLNLLGADNLSNLASSRTAIKLLAIVSFIAIRLLLITGRAVIGAGVFC